MRRTLHRRLLTATLAGAAMLMIGVVPAQARPFETGVLDIDAYSQDSTIPFERTKALGATYVKRNVYWTNVAPEGAVKPDDFEATDPGDPQYSWAQYDRFVRRAVEHGLEPILTVTNTPEWARNRCRHASECAPVPSDYAEFAQAIATRYSGTYNPPDDDEGILPRVRHYQAWVEPNLDYFYKPVFHNGRPISPITYRQVLNAFYDAIHFVDNTNKVISAGLAPLARPGTTIGPYDFMQDLMCMRGGRKPRPMRGCRGFVKLDIWATHPYTTGGPTHRAPTNADVALGDLHKMSRLLRAADRHRKIRKSAGPRRTPFWVTEFSYDSRPPDPGGLVTPIHTRWSTEAMFRMYRAGVDAMIWFGYRDQQPDGRPHCELFDSGLFRRGGTLAQDRPKRFAYAFRLPLVALKIRNGFHVWGRTADSRPGPVLLQLRNGRGGFRSVRRIRARAGGVFEGNVRVRGRLARNAVVRARTRSGTSVPFSLRYVRDFYQPPFGRCVGGGGGRPNSN